MQQQTERLVCSADHPYQTVGSPRGAQWEHPDAEETGRKTTLAGTVVRRRCPNCGLAFDLEITKRGATP